MQRVAASNLAFIINTSAFKFAALKDRADSVRMLISIGESAFAQRRWDDLAQVGDILTSSSLPASYKAIGSYYRGLAANPLGHGDREEALRAYEYTVVNAPPVFQARAVISLGALAANVKDRSTEAELYREAIDRATRSDCQDVYTVVQASRMIAILHSLDGDHCRAVDELEQLWPMARTLAVHDPITYLNYLNSLAIELGEVSQVEQAWNAARIVIASPFVTAYPEWQETADDLAAMQSQAIIISVPEIKLQPEANPQLEPQLKVSTQSEPISLISWLWFIARPVRLAHSASATYTTPILINPILARYVKRARIRAPDFPSN